VLEVRTDFESTEEIVEVGTGIEGREIEETIDSVLL
jgi:hypothetical protein